MIEPCRTRDPIINENVLLERAARGDGIAFSEIVARHYPRAVAIAYGLLKHEDLVDQVVQDAFVRTFLQLRLLTTPRAFTIALYRTLLPLCMHLMTGKSTPLRLQPPWYARFDNAPTEIELAERALRRAMLPCTPQQQATVLLAEMGGFDDTTIAAILKQTPERIAQTLLQTHPQEPIRHCIAVVIGKPNSLLALREIRRQITHVQQRMWMSRCYHAIRDAWMFHRTAMRIAGIVSVAVIAASIWFHTNSFKPAISTSTSHSAANQVGGWGSQDTACDPDHPETNAP